MCRAEPASLCRPSRPRAGCCSMAGSRSATAPTTGGCLADLEVPPTLLALIAARLDALDPSLRSLLEDASVLGQTFTRRRRSVPCPAGRDGDSGRRFPDLVPGGPDARRRPTLAERGQYGLRAGAGIAGGLPARFGRDRRSRHLAAAGQRLRARWAMTRRSARSRPTTSTPTGCQSRPRRRRRSTTQARLSLRAAAERAVALRLPGAGARVSRPGAREVARDTAAPGRLAGGSAATAAGALGRDDPRARPTGRPAIASSARPRTTSWASPAWRPRWGSSGDRPRSRAGGDRDPRARARGGRDGGRSGPAR